MSTKTNHTYNLDVRTGVWWRSLLAILVISWLNNFLIPFRNYILEDTNFTYLSGSPNFLAIPWIFSFLGFFSDFSFSDRRAASCETIDSAELKTRSTMLIISGEKTDSIGLSELSRRKDVSDL